MVEQLAVSLDRSEWGELLPSIVAATDASPEVADDLIDDLVGPLFYRRLVRRTPTSVAWAPAHTERVLATRCPTTRP